MHWSQSIDIYCERVDASLLSEPLNLVSNISFLLAAVLAWRANRRDIGRSSWNDWLCGFGFLVGLGSATFHSFGTLWAQALDVIPIGIFVVVSLSFIARTAFGRTWRSSVIAIVGYGFVTAVLAVLVDPRWVNGSQLYFGIVPTLLFLGWKAPPMRRYLLIAAGIFCVSVVFRSIDMHVCDSFSLGTHFLWHLCNGVMNYFVLRTISCASNQLAEASH